MNSSSFCQKWSLYVGLILFLYWVECLIYDITVSAVSDSDTLLVLMLRASCMPDSVPAGVCRNTASLSPSGSHYPHSKVRKVGLDELEMRPWFSSSQLAGGGLLPLIWSPGALSARCLQAQEDCLSQAPSLCFTDARLSLSWSCVPVDPCLWMETVFSLPPPPCLVAESTHLSNWSPSQLGCDIGGEIKLAY